MKVDKVKKIENLLKRQQEINHLFSEQLRNVEGLLKIHTKALKKQEKLNNLFVKMIKTLRIL